MNAKETNSRTATRAIFKCRGDKGCGRIFRVEVEFDGMNFTRPAGVVHAGQKDARPVAGCPDCGRFIFGKAIHGTFKPEKTCDGRCTGATGPSCDCSCGGENHGANHG